MSLSVPEVSENDLCLMSGEDLSQPALRGFSAESWIQIYNKAGPVFRLKETNQVVACGEQANKEIWRARDLWGYRDTSFGDIFVTQFGEGYITACDGDYHRQQRKSLRPVMSPEATRPHGQIVYDVLSQGISKITGKTVDLHDELIFLYTRILNQTMVKSGASDDMIKRFAIFEEEFIRGSGVFGDMRKKWYARPSYQELHTQVLGYFEALVERRLKGERAGDNLDELIEQMLVQADEKNQPVNRAELLRDAYLMQAGGAGNMATVFCLLLWALNQQPNWLHLLREELRGSDPQTLAQSGIKNLPITRAVILETERCFAPNAASNKLALSDTELLGYAIAQNTEVTHLSSLVNFQDEYYENPMQFDPQRWIDGAPRRAVLFGGGEHVCAGMHVANLFLLISMLVIIPNYEVTAARPPRSEPVDPSDDSSPSRLLFDVRLAGEVTKCD